jgi:hypothetical protein
MLKINRIREYIEVLADLKKLPPMFQNVVALSAAEFKDLIA